MLLGPVARLMLVCWGLRPVGLLRWPVGPPRVPVRPVGAPDHSPGRNPGWAGYPMRSNTGGAGTSIRAHGPVWWAYAVAPRGFAAQGFALGYGPPGLQPGRVRPIRALRPGWGAYAIRPYRGTCIRVPSGTRPNSPASADARPYTGTCIRVPSGTRPASLPRQGPSADAPTPRKPSAACFEPSEASETLKQLVWAFPRPRKP